MSSIGISFYGRFAVTLSATGELDVAESWPGTGGQHEAVMHSTPEGEIHLVERNAEQRHIIRVEENRAVTVAENIYAVKPDDSQYFSDLNRDLAAYEDLLVQAAEHAGFNRAEMTRPDGSFDRDFLNERVNPVVANPEFADVLPPRLVADMMRLTHSLAMRLNPPEYHAGSITPRAYRLTNYFNTALGNRRS